MKNPFYLLFILFLSIHLHAQNTITGSFPPLANQTIKLTGFGGFSTYHIDSVKAGEKGDFSLKLLK